MTNDCKHTTESDRCNLCGLLLDGSEKIRAIKRKKIADTIAEAHSRKAYELDEHIRDKLDIWTTDE